MVSLEFKPYTARYTFEYILHYHIGSETYRQVFYPLGLYLPHHKSNTPERGATSLQSFGPPQWLAAYIWTLLCVVYKVIHARASFLPEGLYKYLEKARSIRIDCKNNIGCKQNPRLLFDEIYEFYLETSMDLRTACILLVERRNLLQCAI